MSKNFSISLGTGYLFTSENLIELLLEPSTGKIQNFAYIVLCDNLCIIGLELNNLISDLEIGDMLLNISLDNTCVLFNSFFDSTIGK